jgi:hypothetical protein
VADFGSLTGFFAKSTGFYDFDMRYCVLYRRKVFDVGHPNVADTKDHYFLCRLCIYNRHQWLLVSVVLRQLVLISSPYKWVRPCSTSATQ